MNKGELGNCNEGGDKCREVARRVMCYRDGGYYESGMYMSVGTWK